MNPVVPDQRLRVLIILLFRRKRRIFSRRLRGAAIQAQTEELMRLLPQWKRLPDKLLPQVTAQVQITAQAAQASPTQEPTNQPVLQAPQSVAERVQVLGTSRTSRQ